LPRSAYAPSELRRDSLRLVARLACRAEAA